MYGLFLLSSLKFMSFRYDVVSVRRLYPNTKIQRLANRIHDTLHPTKEYSDK